VAAVAAMAKATGQPLRLVVTSGASLQVRISHIGRDYVAGSLGDGEGTTAVIPSLSIVVADLGGPLGEDSPEATSPAARSHFRAMLVNSQRLSHRVNIHTVAGHHSGVIDSVALDAIALTTSPTSQRLVLIRHIVWIGVLGH
jgi:hypothetical protein